jgi:hypothetical protein
MAKNALFLSFFLCVSLAVPAERVTRTAPDESKIKGLRPLANRADYAVTCFTESIGVGANLIRPEQVRNLFGADVDRNYIVVEVGFYSKTHSPFDVRHADFALRNRPSRTLVKSADPRMIGASLLKPVNGLVERTLPEVSTTQAVAGYLFFPITEASASFYEIDYTGYGAWLTLPLKPH